MKVLRPIIGVPLTILVVGLFGWIGLFGLVKTTYHNNQTARGVGFNTAIIILYAGDRAWYWLCNPLKVTDPNDPRFNPLKFKFTDYTTDSQRFLAFKKMFSPGDDRAYVEQILVKSAEGQPRPMASHYRGYYWTPWKWTGDSYSVSAVYDDREKLIALGVGAGILFGSEALKQAHERAISEERQRKGLTP